MKTLIVFTHPNPDSFNHALLNACKQGLTEAGHTIKINDLYQKGFDPVLYANELQALQTGDIPPRIKKEQSLLNWAESLVFIYPLWWYERPAMLKGWFDVVFTNGVAFEYNQDGITGLLAHKKAQVIITAGGSKDYFQHNQATDTIHKPLTQGTLEFCGIPEVNHTIFYDIANCDDNKRERMLKHTRNIFKNL